MKKFLYSACMMLAVCAAFVSCQKDVETGHDPAENLYPQKDVVGVYEGQWCRTLDGVTDTIDGSLTLVAVDTAAFQVEVSVLCESISLTGTSVANIAQEGSHGYVFYNMSSSNGLGADNFRGRVQNDVATIDFKKSMRAGRFEKIFTFHFSGIKAE